MDSKEGKEQIKGGRGTIEEEKMEGPRAPRKQRQEATRRELKSSKGKLLDVVS